MRPPAKPNQQQQQHVGYGMERGLHQHAEYQGFTEGRRPGLGSSEQQQQQVEFTFKPRINDSSREMVRLKYPRDR